MTKKTDDYHDTYQTVRIWKKTHKLLKVMAAEQEDSLVVLLNRLVEDEWQRMKEEGQDVLTPMIEKGSYE